MDEGRKRVLGIMAAILAARKLAQQDSTRPSPASNSAIHDAVIFAERILREIDERFPHARAGWGT
jgi:hypothetical protein